MHMESMKSHLPHLRQIFLGSITQPRLFRAACARDCAFLQMSASCAVSLLKMSSTSRQTMTHVT